MVKYSVFNLDAAVKLKNGRHICQCFEIKQNNDNNWYSSFPRPIIPMKSSIPAIGDRVYRKYPILKPLLLVSLMGTIYFLKFS